MINLIKFKQFFLITLLCVILIACNQDENPQDISEYYGVWANDDAELVQTEKYTLIFYRDEDKIEIYLRKNKTINDTLYSFLMSGYIFDPQTKEHKKLDPGKGTQKPYRNFIRLTDDKLEISLKEKNIQLQKIENLNICKSYEMPYADEHSIGKCLQNWQLGVIDNSSQDFINIQIGTNKHSYIYMESPNMLYLRGARLRHNNNGSLFAQNIRLMINENTGEKTAFMENNNKIVSSEDLMINNSSFQPDECTYAKDGIYWSLISFEPSWIKLNGCGEEYFFSRPEKKMLAEWFEYEPY